MSYILDALRRSETERRHQRTGATTPPSTVRDPGRRRRARALAGAGGVLLVALALATAIWFRGLLPGSATEDASGASETATAPAPQPADTHDSSLAAAAAAGKLSSDTDDATDGTPASEPAAASGEDRDTASEPPGTANRETDTGQRADTSTATAGAASGSGQSGGEAVAFSDLPLDFRSRLPAFTVNVHVYAPEPEHRFIMVDMTRYREGETLAVGPRVEAIKPQGVVLAWQGRRFRLPVGNGPRG